MNWQEDASQLSVAQVAANPFFGRGIGFDVMAKFLRRLKKESTWVSVSGVVHR